MLPTPELHLFPIRANRDTCTWKVCFGSWWDMCHWESLLDCHVALCFLHGQMVCGAVAAALLLPRLVSHPGGAQYLKTSEGGTLKSVGWRVSEPRVISHQLYIIKRIKISIGMLQYAYWCQICLKDRWLEMQHTISQPVPTFYLN